MAQFEAREASSGAGSALVSLEGKTEIRIEREFDAPVETVFAAWTTAKSVQQWWDPTGAPLARAEIDLRPGGRFAFIHAGNAHCFSGTYRTIDRPSLLVFATDAPGGGETIGTLSFEPRGNRTRLVMTMLAPTPEAREQLLRFGVDKGTVRTLENLHAFLGQQPRS